MWWEDIELGVTTPLGAYTFTEEEMIRFSRAYDPQPFHIDPEAAKASFYGGIIASGWHVAAVWMKLMIASSQKRAAELGDRRAGGVSPGFLNLRWIKPTRPGMTLHYDTTTHEKIALKSRPELGLLRSLNLAVDENGETVMSFVGQGFWPRRPKE
ncbi:MAG: MaoC family dehydratase [Alphaproteobacteria bacterium]